MAAASTALVKAMTRLVRSASMMRGLEKAFSYQASEKPCQTMGFLPALKLPPTMKQIGA